MTALLMNNTAEAVGDLLLGHGNGDTFSAVFTAPLIEEAAKAAFLVGILWRLRSEFDGIVDGVVYAGICAAGFAFTENIYYFGRAFVDYGFGNATTAGVVTAFILRGVLSPFTHPLFTCLTRHRDRHRRPHANDGGAGARPAGRVPRSPSCCTGCGTGRRRWAARRRS